MDVMAALGLARALLREHGLTGWRVSLDRAKTRAGACHFGSRTITLSRPLTRLHSEAEVRDTILHEIAHALVGPQHGHDALWRATAQRIGSTGTRCLDPSTPRVQGDWRGTCARGHEVVRHRRPRRVVSCAKCCPTFNRDHLVTWTYRGRVVAMSDAYLAEFARLTAGRPRQLPDPSPSAQPPSAQPPSARQPREALPEPSGPEPIWRPRLGDLVSLTSSTGELHEGSVEFVGATLAQVRLSDERLVQVNLGVLRPGRERAV
ncbi:MAG: SprT-like domain-containing protein [Tetrasphaera sp.]|nr:SprT-like domain-containing protein [Tetrasphaera sp.]